MKRFYRLRMFRITAAAALCLAGGTLVSGLACSSSTPSGEDQSKESTSARAASDLTAQVNETLGLRSSSVVTLDIDATPGAAATVHLPIAGAQYELDLHPQSVRAANYQVLAQSADGSLVEVDPGPVRTMRGTVVGIEGSAVSASLEEDGLHGRIFLSDDEQYWVEPLATRIPQAGPDHYVVYHNEDMIAPAKTCGLDHLPNALGDRGVQLNQRLVQGGACGTGLCVAELAADADYEYFLDYGSTSAVASRINTVINTVNVQYERDVDITHVITTIIVRTAEPDPYSSTDAVTLLNQFRSHWLNNHGGIQRDIAQLFTGKEIDSSTIGVAWLNAVCTTYGFSMVQSDFNGSFGCATDLTAHELGHNWGADHCSCTSNTMNPFITCANVFHATFSIPEIASFRDSRSCLTGGGGCTGPGDCGDGDLCTDDVCSSGVCSNPPVTCDDFDACTTDSCDPANGNCVYVADVVCDDGDACTTDSCVSPSGCVNDPISPCCGDGVCDLGEDCNSCPADCISGNGTSGCGNGTCEAGEDCLSCPSDCRGKQNGKPSNRYCCNGDGGSDGENPIDCSDNRCTSSGYQCGSAAAYCCGDTTCEGSEDSSNCEIDCGPPAVCGDGFCDAGEDSCNCGADCPGPCECGGNKAACNVNADCCSGNCNSGTCRGN
jgi:hypothetical protein